MWPEIKFGQLLFFHIQIIQMEHCSKMRKQPPDFCLNVWIVCKCGLSSDEEAEELQESPSWASPGSPSRLNGPDRPLHVRHLEWQIAAYLFYSYNCRTSLKTAIFGSAIILPPPPPFGFKAEVIMCDTLGGENGRKNCITAHSRMPGEQDETYVLLLNNRGII